MTRKMRNGARTCRQARPVRARRRPVRRPPAAETSFPEDERILEQAVLSIRAYVRESETAPFIARALQDVRAYMEEHELAPAGPPFSICQPDGPKLMDVEAGWPVREHAPGTPRIHSGDLPRSLLRRSGPAASGRSRDLPI